METILNADGKKTLWLPHEEVHSCWEPVYNNIQKPVFWLPNDHFRASVYDKILYFM